MNAKVTLVGNDKIYVEIILSKSNLEALLAKVDDPESQHTLLRDTDIGRVVVRGETDAEHYFSPDREEEMVGLRGETLIDNPNAVYGGVIRVPMAPEKEPGPGQGLT